MSTAETLMAIFTIVMASTGFWTLVSRVFDNRDAKSQMLRGLGHDRIRALGMTYIQRGWITDEEYDNISEYIYKPYKALGGNGTADKIMSEVDKLTFYDDYNDALRHGEEVEHYHVS